MAHLARVLRMNWFLLLRTVKSRCMYLKIIIIKRKGFIVNFFLLKRIEKEKESYLDKKNAYFGVKKEKI